MPLQGQLHSHCIGLEQDSKLCWFDVRCDIEAMLLFFNAVFDYFDTTQNDTL